MADKEKVVKNEEKAEMEVKVVKTGFFTRAGMWIDRNKKKVALGAAAVAGAVGMALFVSRNNRNADEVELLDDGFTNIEVDATVEDID